MQIETIGKYQLHLSAQEIGSLWDPFLTVMKFDDDKQDFVCALDKHHAGTARPTYDQAIEEARRVGNAYIQSGRKESVAGTKVE